MGKLEGDNQSSISVSGRIFFPLLLFLFCLELDYVFSCDIMICVIIGTGPRPRRMVEFS